jgi:hypothetical protein
MDYATFRTRFKATLNRRDCSDDLADSFVDDAFERINRLLDHHIREATFTYTVVDPDGEQVINLPADTGKKIIEVYVDGSPAQSYPDRTLLMNYYVGYSRRANTLVFPTALPVDTVVTVVYWRDFTRPAVSTDTNDILDKANLLVKYAALSEAGMYFEHTRTAEWAGTFDRILMEMAGEYQDRELSGYGGPMVVQAPQGAGADY